MINIAICDGDRDKVEFLEKMVRGYVVRSSIHDVIVYNYKSVELFISEYNDLNRINIMIVGDDINSFNYKKLTSILNNNSNNCQIISMIDNFYNEYKKESYVNNDMINHLLGMAFNKCISNA